MNDAWGLILQERVTDPAISGLLTVIGVTVVSLGSVAALAGLLILTAAVAPNMTHRAAYCLRTRAAASFFTGLGGGAALLLAMAAAQKVPAVNVLVLAVSTMAGVLAMGATSEVLGRKLYVLAGRDGHRISHLLAGWLTFAFASGVPILGWFVIYPYGVISGLGAAILGFFVREEI